MSILWTMPGNSCSHYRGSLSYFIEHPHHLGLKLGRCRIMAKEELQMVTSDSYRLALTWLQEGASLHSIAPSKIYDRGKVWPTEPCALPSTPAEWEWSGENRRPEVRPLCGVHPEDHLVCILNSHSGCGSYPWGQVLQGAPTLGYVGRRLGHNRCMSGHSHSARVPCLSGFRPCFCSSLTCIYISHSERLTAVHPCFPD